jgi:hypothetical protein
MSEVNQRDIAETLFEQAHDGIKDALTIEQERRAALIKNLYRLRALRLSGAELNKGACFNARG